MPSRFSVVAGPVLAALMLPAAAQAAPTFEPLKPCYVTAGTAKDPQGEGISLRAAGFTPNSLVDLSLNGAPFEGGAGLQVNEQGLLMTQPFRAPFVAKGSQDLAFTLTEQGNPANTVTASTKATRLDVKVKPRSAPPSDRVRFSGSGFTEDKPVYAHYTRRGKQVKRVRMARRPGTCGSWSVRRPQFPIKDPAQGTWFVQFDQSKQYKDGRRGKLQGVFVRIKFEITFVQGR